MVLRRICIIYKINPSPTPGFDSTVLIPRSPLDRGPSAFVDIFFVANYLFMSLAIFDVPLRHLEFFFGFGVLVLVLGCSLE